MRLPKADGMEVLRRCQAMDADLPVIIITGHGDVTLAVEAMRSGAYDFIQKPFAPDLLVDVVRRALDKRALTLEVLDLRRRLAQRDGIESKLIGRSPQMARVRQLVSDVAATRVDVLVRGETGTGKELIAQCLHELSPRKDGPFVALNCGGLPDNLLDSELFGHEAGAFTGAQKRRIGKIEYANKGTLFWTSSRACRWACRSSCCGCCRSGWWSASAPTSSCRWTAAWWPPPRTTSRSAPNARPSAPTCTTGSTW
jgi:two-component system C4-dicarboxylate transport response regulator DctD